jgi:hypothetical protein
VRSIGYRIDLLDDLVRTKISERQLVVSLRSQKKFACMVASSNKPILPPQTHALLCAYQPSASTTVACDATTASSFSFWIAIPAN